LVEETMPARLVASTHGGARQDQSILRPRHTHIEEPPRLLDLRLRGLLPRGRPPWHLRVLHPDHVHARELQTLRRMQRQQVHPLAIHVYAVATRRERDALEERVNLRLERCRLD